MHITHMPWLLVLSLLLTCTELVAAPQQLGTIFFSPTERATLVSARNGEHPVTGNLTNTQRYTITGFIKREDGKNIAWINNKPVNQTKTITKTITMQGTQPSVRISNNRVIIDGKPVQVGETLDSVSGERTQKLPANAIKIK